MKTTEIIELADKMSKDYWDMVLEELYDYSCPMCGCRTMKTYPKVNKLKVREKSQETSGT